MGRYLVRRVFLSIISIIGLGVLTFLLLRLLPGGPFDDDIPLSKEVLSALNQQYGFDRSLEVQIFLYIKNLLSLNLGNSILNGGRPVFEVLLIYLPRTLLLGGISLGLSIFFGFIFGLLFYLSRSVYLVKLIHFVFLSAPTLFLGPLLILIFGVWLDLFPVAVNDQWFSYVLPIFILMIRPTANLARLLMGALEETLSQPWVTTARSYGFSKRKILLRFALKQSLIPVLSYLGPATAGLLSGSLLIETIFNIQGLGSLFINSLVNRDYFLISGLTMFYGSVLIAGSLFFDLLMYLADPRMEKL